MNDRVYSTMIFLLTKGFGPHSMGGVDEGQFLPFFSSSKYYIFSQIYISDIVSTIRFQLHKDAHV